MKQGPDQIALPLDWPQNEGDARFIAHHGPDNEIVGGFTLTTQSSAGIPAMMAEGARRMDELFSTALAAGRLERDPSLNLPAPPPLPVEEKPVEAKPTNVANAFQVQINTGGDVNIYNFAMAHLRTMGGIESATPQLINPTGVSYVLVTYRGSIGQLAGALSGRGWIVETSGGNVVRIRSASGKPPPLPPPPLPPPQATPPAQPPQQNPSGRQP